MPTTGRDGRRPKTLADRLRRSRRSQFVGRTAELGLFGLALSGNRPEFSVLYLHGPGGVGKTALLGMFSDAAAEAGRPVRRVDAREVEPSPVGFLEAVGDRAAGQVVLLDTYELLVCLDDWLRSSYLPSLPADAVVVIAGRNPPTSGWLADAGWQDLVRVVTLGNLLPAESRKYLSARGVPDARQKEIIDFTHGHPLALALVVDVLNQSDEPSQFRPEREPDVLRMLLGRFTDRVPSPRHRRALEACAHVRVTTEELLTEALGGDDAPALFDWLRGLSFVEQGPHGVFPHDLAREVLDTDLRWRNPQAYRRLHALARAEIMRRVQGSHGVAQQLALFDFLFMYRNNGIVRSHHDWEALGQAYAEPATGHDLAEILAMIDLHEDAESAQIAAHWYARQPGGFSAFRNFDGALIGFEATLMLHDATPADIAADPATQTAVDFARRYGPVRTGEQMIYHRFYMTRDSYQVGPAALNVRAMIACRHWLTKPMLAWSFLAVADAEYWRALYEHLNFSLSPDAGFELGGHKYAVFTHDWRMEPAQAWYEAMAERELTGDRAHTGSGGTAPTSTRLAVLSESEFRTAVRQALRDYGRAEALAASPLLRSRVMVDRSGPEPGAAALQALLREAAETLRTNPRDEKFYRAVHRTYLEPAATQELAASRLRVPFSTYRSHLGAGIERITAWMWRRELSGPPADDLAEI